jgi:tetratricopeptide (TPR) repeat protein
VNGAVVNGAVASGAVVSPDAGVLGPSRARLAERLERPAAAEPHEEIRLKLETGAHDAAWARVPSLLEEGLEGRLLAARVLFAVADYERLAPLVADLADAGGGDARVRRLVYRWAFAVDDLARVERLAAAGDAFVDRLAAARLRVHLHEVAAARDAYEAAAAAAPGDEERSFALHGLGVVLYRQRDFDGAFARLAEALALEPLDGDLLAALADALIRLGRTAEAIDALELAVRLAPYHERAHYVLGNGYARRNVSQLAAACPTAFAGAGAAVRRGARAFAERRYADSRRHFAAALGLCPEHGRAHNGLAKALEAQRLRFDVHRARYEERFAASPAPAVPGIELYVVNWGRLEPRHAKAVALAVAPWGRYLPVLLEAGSTHYVKPLHRHLSECPEQHYLRDRRIGYDARLWDDVRGVGGHHTVTGVEDVERMIWNGYNTVLHELTHQVHQVLPAAARRRLQELYRRAKARDAETGDAFLSRYAGSSVWEYFAEGANALATPRRDRFDDREMLRERLAARDPELSELVRELMNDAELDGAYVMASVHRGDQQLRRGRAEGAVAAYRRARERAPDDEDAAGSLAYGLLVAGRAGEALELASAAARAHPESADLAGRHAEALWLAGRGLAGAVAALRAARARVREEERFQVDLALGGYLWTAGDAAGALAAYERVLAYQGDHPWALWGLASTHALAGAWDAAWHAYEEAVRQRSGVTELRIDYARDLLRAGASERARSQLDAALLLDPEEPEALAFAAWWLCAAGRAAEAATAADRALARGPWSDWARLARARAARQQGEDDAARAFLAPLVERMGAETPPEYVYRPEKGSYLLVHTLPASLRAEMRQV